MPRKKAAEPQAQPAPPIQRARRARRTKITMPFYLEGGIVVQITFPSDDMPEYSASHNSLVVATGAAKGGGVQAAILPHSNGAIEPSRTNIRNTMGLGMTRGSMDPVEALNGIPGLTKVEEAVVRTLDTAEASAEAELGPEHDEIGDDVRPEDVVADA